MKDRRLQVFQDAFEGLVESLDAMARLARWTSTEPKPEPLVTSAAKLLDRLGAAGRLSTSRFHGPATDVAKVTAMCDALKRLDAAHLLYRQRVGIGSVDLEALAVLESEVAATAAKSASWR